MSLRALPEIKMETIPRGLTFQPPSQAMDRWQPDIHAADSNTDNNIISVLDYIGDDGWGGGVTSQRVAAALRTIGDGPVTVDVNSPGGSIYEGAAIYNMLRAHPGAVTVRVLGIAASAASVIAMAGDEIQIGKASFVMIHNAWCMAIGDRNGMRATADYLEPFDQAMADVYEDRTGNTPEEIAAWMDKETWFSGQHAIDAGFADALLPTDTAVKDTGADGAARRHVNATRRLDTILAKQGMTRTERRALLSDLKGGTPGAAPAATQDAGLNDALTRLLETIKS